MDHTFCDEEGQLLHTILEVMEGVIEHMHRTDDTISSGLSRVDRLTSVEMGRDPEITTNTIR